MRQPKFTYNQKVDIVKGFYRGREATVVGVIDVGFFRTKWSYLVDVTGLIRCIYLEEDEMAEIKMVEKWEAEK